jgi:hypothetical protein
MSEKIEKKCTTCEPGFWKGLCHGFIAPLKLFLKFFKPDTVIFDTENKSAKYKVGLFLGLVVSIIKSHSTVEKSKSKEDKTIETE